MNFNDLTGQRRVVESLKNAIDNNMVSHAYIFEGPVGIGKKTIASIFSSALVCEEDNGKPCCKCTSCIQSEHGNHPDIKTIVESERASIGIDLKKKKKKDIYIKPYEAKRKIYIIPEADTLTTQAQNGLLKILEEPPHYAIIILIVENAKMLINTVMSRSVLIKFNLYSLSEVKDYLMRSYPGINEEATALAAFSGGIIGKAISMVSSPEFRDLRKRILGIFMDILKDDETTIFDSATFFSDNKGEIDSILEILISIARDVLLIKEINSTNHLINIDMKDDLEMFSSRVRRGVMEKVIDIISDTKGKIAKNANYSLAIEMMLIKSREGIYDKRNWGSF